MTKNPIKIWRLTIDKSKTKGRVFIRDANKGTFVHKSRKRKLMERAIKLSENF